MRPRSLHRVPVGTPVVVGDHVIPMPRVAEGDILMPVHRTGDLLTITSAEYAVAESAVGAAQEAFEAMAAVDDESVTAFFEAFARRLADDETWSAISAANDADVQRASAAGRSTTRLAVSPAMREAMISGLRGWAAAPSRRDELVERRRGEGWTVERRRTPLGVVAFVFEGRPNVFADGAGVLRGGNTAVMRIGGDALTTAIAIEDDAVRPSLAEAGLPEGAITLVRSRAHGAAHALFSLPSVRLAVARGSGSAVALLGSIAEQHGISASLHGTGGAWMYLAGDCDERRARVAIAGSLDRKVCNTLNVLVLEAAFAERLAPLAIDALVGRDDHVRLHVVEKATALVPPDWFERTVPVRRPEGQVVEVQADVIDEDDLGREWEWEQTPELSLAVADDDDHAARLANRHSPRFVASILTRDPARFERFTSRVDAPYVGDGFTRWVDGQWAWGRPELGLTNWERGRLLGRSGILSGEDVYSIRDVFRDETGDAPTGR